MTSTSQNNSSIMYPNSLTPLPGIGQSTTTTTVTTEAPMTTTVTTYPTTGYLFTTGGLFMPGFVLEPTAFVNTQTVCATDLQVQSAAESQLHKSRASKSCEDLAKKTYCQEEVDAYINDKVAEKIKELKLKMEEKEKIEAKKVVIEEKVEEIQEKLRRSRSAESQGGCQSRENSASSSTSRRAVCNKCHDVLVKELSLDEKIKRIREELNLPPERSEARCADSMHSRHYHDFHFGNTKCHQHHECDEYAIVGRTPTTKYKTNVVRPRSSRSLNRSSSELGVTRRSKSRSLSAKSTTAANRPAWRCTSTNDYTHTMVSRADLLAKQYAKEYIAAEKLRTNSAGTQTRHDRHKACQTSLGEPSYYKTHYEPAAKPQYYKTSTSYYKTTEHLPHINASTTTTQHCTTNYDVARPSTSMGYDYNNSSSYYYSRPGTPKYVVQENVKYPSIGNTAKYICYPAVERHSTKQAPAATAYYVNSQAPTYHKSPATMSLKPIETTKGGAIYRNPTRANEIHYVSDNARNAWYSGAKNGLVKIHNAGTTIIHD